VSAVGVKTQIGALEEPSDNFAQVRNPNDSIGLPEAYKAAEESI
jgi:hypothetical protein